MEQISPMRVAYLSGYADNGFGYLIMTFEYAQIACMVFDVMSDDSQYSAH